MAKIFSIVFAAILGLFCILSAQASPVPENEGPARQGRFYGIGGAQASASANAGAMGYGMGGFPYGGGYGVANANAFASSNAMGYGK